MILVFSLLDHRIIDVIISFPLFSSLPSKITRRLANTFDFHRNGVATGISRHVSLLHHGRRAGEEKKTEIRLASGNTTLILQIETGHL